MRAPGSGDETTVELFVPRTPKLFQTEQLKQLRVAKLRTAFPRIHVVYVADERGNANGLALPELSAYLCAADVRERDW